MSKEGDLLVTLVGDFREFRGEMKEFAKNMEKQLSEIDTRLEKGTETFTEIQERCAERLSRLKIAEDDVEKLKTTQLSLKTKLAIAIPFLDVIGKYGSELWITLMKVVNGG